MDLNQLESFLKVAETGSVTRAAKVLHLTQPAVTKQMATLEKQLGVPLLERSGRGIRLTHSGELLLDYAQRALALLEEGRQRIRDESRGESGRIAIGAGVTTSIVQLPEWLRRLRETSPAAEIIVRTGESREVIQWVADRELDLGIVTSPRQVPHLRVVPLFEEEIDLIASADFMTASRRLKVADLETAPLILFPRGNGFREFLEQTFAAQGVTLRPKMENDSVEVLKSFVAMKLGIAFLPLAAVRQELETGVLQQIRITGAPALRRRTAVVYREDRYLNAVSRRFLEILQAPAAPN
jgi:DNA-binding transcriptional LysR family regulator